MDDVYVVQVNTDGDSGFPKDRVVEIGIARADLSTGHVDSFYYNRVALPPGSFMRRQREYMLANSGLTPEDLQSGRPEEEVVADVKRLLNGRTVTSFDIGVTFMRFLLMDPWDLTHEATLMASCSAGLPASLKGRADRNENEMIRLAYDALFPGDAKGMGDGRSALDLALKSAFIMLELRRRGL